MKALMLQNHVRVANISESMFPAEEESPSLNKSQNAVLDFQVASGLLLPRKQNKEVTLVPPDWQLDNGKNNMLHKGYILCGSFFPLSSEEG